MKRALIGLCMVVSVTAVFAGPASAANQTTTFSFHGTFAEAAWFTDSVFTYINVSRATQGQELSAFQNTNNFDKHGNFTGRTQTIVDVTSGFSFAIDRSKLSSASTSGSSLPATTCSYDANFNLIGCENTTIDVNATWTGEGPIERGTSNEHFQSDGFKVTEHFNGTLRNATASGSIGGLTLTTGDVFVADLGITTRGETVICIGSC